jgi:hypothetical protein
VVWETLNRGILLNFGGDVKSCSNLWKVCHLLKKVNIKLDLYSKEIKVYTCSKTCPQVLKTALFIKSKSRKQSKYSSNEK